MTKNTFNWNHISSDLTEDQISDLKNSINNRIIFKTKSLTIPKQNYKWHLLLSASEITGIDTLQEIFITNVYIKRTNRYHDIESDYVGNSFGQLELFFSQDYKGYYCFYSNHPSNWTMDCYIEYIVKPKQIK